MGRRERAGGDWIAGFYRKSGAKHLGGRQTKGGEESGLGEVAGIRAEVVLSEVAQIFWGKERGDSAARTKVHGCAVCRKPNAARNCMLSLREIGERVGLHYNAVGNAIRQVRNRPTAAQAKRCGTWKLNLRIDRRDACRAYRVTL